MGKAVWGMVKRIILWKIKEDHNKQANLELLREGLLSLSTKIGDIVSVEVGLNFSSADYDIIFIVAFSDPFQLKQFQSNPEYLKIFQHAQTISTNMIFCDYMAETSTTVAPGGGNMPGMPPGPKGLIGTNTGRIPNLNNPNNLQQNNMGGNGMFGNMPKQNNLDNTKPFSPLTNKNALPFAGREYANQNNPQNTPNNQYNGFGNVQDEKNGVNFTVSENVNQIRFANGNKDIGMNTNDDTWQCSKCGKTNSSYINMCSCGRKKPLDNMQGGMKQGNMQNSMLLNSALLPKVPSMPKSNIPSSNGAWLCPSCGKSNNEFMKVCVCGQRKKEPNTPNNNGPGGFGNSSPMGFNGPNMNMPKNPSMGMNNIKSPNNNDFFNSFGGGNSNMGGPMNGPGGMNKPGGPNMGGPMNGPGGMNKPGGPNMGGPMNGPGGMSKPMGPNMSTPMNGPGGMNKPMGPNMGGPMNGPGGMNKPMGPNMGGPMNGPGGMNKPMGPNMGGPMNGPNNMSRLGHTSNIVPNKNGGPANLPPDSWKCPRCGKVLGNFVGQCVCGQRKPTRPVSPPNGPGPNNTHMRFN